MWAKRLVVSRVSVSASVSASVFFLYAKTYSKVIKILRKIYNEHGQLKGPEHRETKAASNFLGLGLIVDRVLSGDIPLEVDYLNIHTTDDRGSLLDLQYPGDKSDQASRGKSSNFTSSLELSNPKAKTCSTFSRWSDSTSYNACYEDLESWSIYANILK